METVEGDTWHQTEGVDLYGRAIKIATDPQALLTHSASGQSGSKQLPPSHPTVCMFSLIMGPERTTLAKNCAQKSMRPQARTGPSSLSHLCQIFCQSNRKSNARVCSTNIQGVPLHQTYQKYSPRAKFALLYSKHWKCLEFEIQKLH